MNDSLGERLRKIRESRGLTQSEFARKAGFKPSAISHFESNRREPSFKNIQRLADSLAITIDFLAGREINPGSLGPVVEQLLKDFSFMSLRDREIFIDIAKILTTRSMNGDIN